MRRAREGKKVYSVLGLHICTELTEYHTEYCMEKREVCDLLALLACVAVRYYYDLVGMLLCSRFDFWWASAGWLLVVVVKVDVLADRSALWAAPSGHRRA